MAGYNIHVGHGNFKQILNAKKQNEWMTSAALINELLIVSEKYLIRRKTFQLSFMKILLC